MTPNATVMSWRGGQGGIVAARQQHKAIMSPGDYMYLHHAQDKDAKSEPLAIGGYLLLEVIYNYKLLPAALNEEQQKNILGVQGNVWTEYMATDNKLEYMLFPRIFPLVETG